MAQAQTLHKFKTTRISVSGLTKVESNLDAPAGAVSIEGIQILAASADEAKVALATCGLAVDGVEIFPTDFPAHKLYGSSAVPQNERMYFFDFLVPVKTNSKITIVHTPLESLAGHTITYELQYGTSVPEGVEPWAKFN